MWLPLLRIVAIARRMRVRHRASVDRGHELR
jgi:hypothetical protein